MKNKIYASLLGVCFAIALYSCSNNDTVKNEDLKKDSTAADTTTASGTADASFKPFDVMEVIHTVKDYATWRPLYDNDSAMRLSHGIHKIAIGRDADNPNKVLIAMQTDDVQKAKEFSASPELKAVMDKAGVVSRPDVTWWHVVRYNPNSHEKQWVVVSHKVKDYDAWLKVYDSEGTAARLNDGMVDVVIARGIQDPNMVHLVFDIKDMAKAKAAMMSDAKKKLMESAGVIGAPTMEFFNEADQ